MIEVRGLCKQFKVKKKGQGLRQTLKSFAAPQIQMKAAVNEISFHIDRGEVVGFLGPNGAGKTTTLKMLSGILYPTGGEAFVSGYVPWERKNEFKRRISIVLGQKNQLWWDLPSSESLYLNKCIYGIEDSAYERNLSELCELLQVKDLLDVQVRNLSLGERMNMELVAALIHKPEVIFLDEPTIGLDLIAQKNIREFLKYYNQQEKTTVMLTSHYLEDIANLCERAIVINHGTIVYDGELSTINKRLAQTKVLKIKTDDDISEFFNGRNLTGKDAGGIWELRVDRDIVQEVITDLLSTHRIMDFSVGDVPLEESLEVLYR